MNEKHLLEERLQSERPHYSAPAGFTERVLNRLPDRISRNAPRRVPVLWVQLGFACGAALAIAIVFIHAATRRTPLDAPTPIVQHLPNSQSATVQLPEISLAQVQALSTKLDEPLQTELKNVISDTRQAIQFVASNFLPEN
jgi:hypothetical protein